jgi:hypothetical protein
MKTTEKRFVWLSAMVLAALLMGACSKDDDLTVQAVSDNHYYYGTYAGCWNLDGNDSILGMTNGFTGTDKSFSTLQSPDTLTISKDSIRFSNFHSRGYVDLLLTELLTRYEDVFNRNPGWNNPSELLPNLQLSDTAFEARLLSFGNTSTIDYLVFLNQEYEFLADVGAHHHHYRVEFSEPGLCVVNHVTRIIVVELRIKRISADGFESLGFEEIPDYVEWMPEEPLAISFLTLY